MDRRYFLTGLGAAALPLAAQAQTARPIRVIVPFVAGGATDVTTRIITEKAAQTLGVNMVVENRPGGGGGIGVDMVAKAAPDGVDVFFDNVGGETLDIVLDNLAPAGARVAICGAISQYQNLDDVRGPKLYLRLAERNAMMKGFVVSHYEADYPAALEEISALMKAGKLTLPEHVVRGIDHFPDALLMLFDGRHLGNLVVRP